MDSDLAEAVARRIAAWMDTAAMFARNEDFYRGLLDRCATTLGRDAFTADDGSVYDSPVRLKIPELVERLTQQVRNAGRSLRSAQSDSTAQTKHD